MQYTQETFDRRTGEPLCISIGDWVTITEIGQLYGVGNRQVRSILRQMNFLHVEGGGVQHRHRLCRWVTEKGWGKRIEHRHKSPFDVVSPEGQAWIAERWAKVVDTLMEEETQPTKFAMSALEAFKSRRRGEMPVQGMVYWLADHLPELTQMEIASIVDVSQPLVGRYLTLRSSQRRKLLERKNAPLSEVDNRRHRPATGLGRIA